MAWRNSSNVALEIRRSITDGTYRRFDRLPASRQLAESFGVARNTLRDALQQLEREGLLEIRPGSGAYVTGLGDRSISKAVEEAAPLELIDARFALEPHICRLCVLHGKREDFETMDGLCRKMENSTTDPTTFAEADTAFHKALASATRNNLLIWLIEQINTVRSLDEWTRMRQLTLGCSHDWPVQRPAPRDPECAALPRTGTRRDEDERAPGNRTPLLDARGRDLDLGCGLKPVDVEPLGQGTQRINVGIEISFESRRSV